MATNDRTPDQGDIQVRLKEAHEECQRLREKMTVSRPCLAWIIFLPIRPLPEASLFAKRYKHAKASRLWAGSFNVACAED
jgi:hypothetical protein